MIPPVSRLAAPAPRGARAGHASNSTTLPRPRRDLPCARRRGSSRPVLLALLAALVVALLGGVAGTAHGQRPLAVRGKVVRQTVDGMRIVPRELVTLHRVNAREAGAIDSMLTDASGAFAFRVAAPDSQSMYLASARYGGIAYFSAPIEPGNAGPPPSEIVVYDTTSAEVRLQLQGRHLVVSAPNADGVRSVIDVLEISNDTVLTRVAGASNRATFSLLLPEGARQVRASQGDVAEGAVEVRNGRAELYAPLSPGLRQLVLTYELPASAFPVPVPLESAVSVLEVLLEEKGASAEGATLVNKGGVTVDGKVFERYLGEGASANAVVTLRAAGGIGGTSLPTWVLPVAIGALTLGVIVLLSRGAPAGAAPGASVRAAATPTPTLAAGAAQRRGNLAGATPAAPADAVTRLARQVAAVDALLERDTVPSSNMRDELSEYRRALMDQLVHALARTTEVR